MFDRIAVLGVGAIGGVIGGYLTRAGQDVTLIDPWAANIDTIRTHGLKVTAQDEEFTVQANAVHLGDVSSISEPFDMVFLCMKSYDTVWATHFIMPYLTPTGIIVSAQNGINDERIAAISGHSRTLGCVITLGAGLYDAGNPLRTSAPDRPAFIVGELTGVSTTRVEALADLIGVIGPTKVTTNLWGHRWAKLATNSMANPMCALTGLGSAAVRETPNVVDITVKIGAEVVRVGTALGVEVEPINGIPSEMYVRATEDAEALEELISRLAEGAGQLGTGKPSMLQDVMKGRHTEIEYLNGYVAQRGRAVGVATPACDAITELINRVERGQLPSDASNIDYLNQFI